MFSGRNVQKSVVPATENLQGQALSCQLSWYFQLPAWEFSISSKVQMKRSEMGVEAYTIMVN